MALSKDRKGRVTGSVCGGILGLSPFMTRKDVMRMMVREYYGLEKYDKETIPTISYGKRMEEYALEVLGAKGSDEFFKYEDWLGATPDGFKDEYLVEVKCPYGKRKEDSLEFKPLEDQQHYYAQHQIELLCANKKHGIFYQWSPYQNKEEETTIDMKWLNKNIPILKDFWDEYNKICRSEHLPEEFYDKPVINEGLPEGLVSRYLEIKQEVKSLKEEQSKIIKDLADITKGKSAIISGHNFTFVEKVGSISYAKIVKEAFPDMTAEEMEPYRGKPSSFWIIR